MVLFRNAEKMSTVPLQGLNIIKEVYVFYISSQLLRNDGHNQVKELFYTVSKYLVSH